MNVSEVMTGDVYIASPDETIQSAAQTMADLDTGVLPVGESDRLVGVLTDRDITVRCVAEARDITTCTIRDVMSPEVRYCFEDDDVEEAALKMSEWQVRRLPVLNRDKRLVGIVSLGDLAREATPEVSGAALSGISDAGSDGRDTQL
jgi:CBS domain-containing protein